MARAKYSLEHPPDKETRATLEEHKVGCLHDDHEKTMLISDQNDEITRIESYRTAEIVHNSYIDGERLSSPMEQHPDGHESQKGPRDEEAVSVHDRYSTLDTVPITRNRIPGSISAEEVNKVAGFHVESAVVSVKLILLGENRPAVSVSEMISIADLRKVVSETFRGRFRANRAEYPVKAGTEMICIPTYTCVMAIDDALRPTAVL
jgi:hypothetical protein